MGGGLTQIFEDPITWARDIRKKDIKKTEQFRFLECVSLTPTCRVRKSNPGDIKAGAKVTRRPYLGKYGS